MSFSLADLSLKRPIFISCLVILMIVMGYQSLKKIPVELFPDVTPPVVAISTSYPGAGPREIETLITKPIEEAVTTVGGIKRVSSKSLEGISQVIAEFILDKDIKYAEQQVRDKISAIKARLPEDVKEPIIQTFNFSDTPIIELTLNANLSAAELYDLANEYLRPQLEQVEDVARVQITGGRKREIAIDVDRDMLQKRELSLNMIAGRLNQNGENVPGGKVDSAGKEKVYRTLGEYQDLKSIAQTPINFVGNENPSILSDVAQVSDSLTETKNLVFINGKPSLAMQVFKKSGANTVSVSDNIKKKIDKLTKTVKDSQNKKDQKILIDKEGSPEIQVVRDGTKQIRDNIFDVKETIFLGIILTIIVVFLFLGNGRSTLITALAIPNSLLGAFILMEFFGVSINIVSLLGLSIAVGLLIDDAIVVRENIFRYIQKGYSPFQAARIGTKEVALAVIATTLVIISVFGPIALVHNFVGKVMAAFGLVVCFAMIISLFDALTMAPMLSAYFSAETIKEKPKSFFALPFWWFKQGWHHSFGALARAFDRLQDKLEHLYEQALVIIQTYKKTTIALTLFLSLASCITAVFLPKTFLPKMDTGEYSVSLEMPIGTNLESMTTTAQQIDAKIRNMKEVEKTRLQVGDPYEGAFKSAIYVKLIDSKLRKDITTSDMQEKTRDLLKDFAFAKPTVKDYDISGSNNQRPFTLRLVGQNGDLLKSYMDQLMAKLKDNKAFIDLDTSYREGKPELQIVIDTNKAKSYGLSTKTIGNEVRAMIEGLTPGVFRHDGKEYDLRLRFKDGQRDLQSNFNDIYVPNINNKLVKLADVASLQKATGPASINRQDRARYIEISAEINKSIGLGDAQAQVDKILKTELPLPQGITTSLVGEGENFKDLGQAMQIILLLSLLFIYMILASLYESFITPITIILTMIASIGGAFVALLIFGQSLNLFSVLGLLLLMGVSCKNSILIVDYANHLIEQGKSIRDAIIEASKTRLRPILMTSLALIAGALPLAIGLNEASRQRVSMGYGIIGGVISSTVLSLILVPALLPYILRFGAFVRKIFALISGMAENEKSQEVK